MDARIASGDLECMASDSPAVNDMRLFSFDLVSALFRHTIWAICVFVLLALGMETFMPGSVTPYLDPIPYAVVGLGGLFIDAVFRTAPQKKLLGTIWLCIVIAISLGVIALLIQGNGLRHLSALALIFAMITGAVWMIGGQNENAE